MYSHGQAAHMPLTKNSANYQYGHPGMYGTSLPFAPTSHEKKPFVRGQRRSMNIVAICISFFLPWLLFCVIYWDLSFSLHYKNIFLCCFIALVGLCVVAVTGILAFDAIRKKRAVQAGQAHGVHHEPTWLIFLFVTCLLAWCLGVMAGDINFFNHLEPYFDVSNLNTYPGVDPSRMRGQQLMDAGRVLFTPGTKLDISRSRGFKNIEIYCVAPIVAGTDPKKMPSYDFWAVGLNCCSGERADFHCGEFNNARASAGLRLMRDDERPFYRLAVQQAEAAYNIRADHPLFFHWMHDPIAEVGAYYDEGFRYFLLGIFAHFILQLFLVIVAALAFSKMNSW